MQWNHGGASSRAEQWLKNYLSNGDQPAITSELLKADYGYDSSFVRGFGFVTLVHVKRQLGVISYRSRRTGRWFWSLPNNEG